jgi:hypothetical protein
VEDNESVEEGKFEAGGWKFFKIVKINAPILTSILQLQTSS